MNITDESNGWISASQLRAILEGRKIPLDPNKSLTQHYAHSMIGSPSTTSSPKARDSSHKVPVNLCPASAIIAIALVIAQGHKKPGRTIYNWRTQPISYVQYHGAAQRHLLRSIDGSDHDAELSELASDGRKDDQGNWIIQVRHDWAAMSCLAIIEDARQAGTLVDDRPVKGGAEKFLEILQVKQEKK